MATAAYKKGDEVDVFYRMGKRSTPQRKYLAMLDQRQGIFRPRTGISDGWIPARVVEANETDVRIEYRWQNFFTQRGHMAEPYSGWTEWYKNSDVKPCPAQLQGTRARLPVPDDEPELVLLTFRWGGLNEVIAPSQWGETGSSVSDTFVDSFVDMAVLPRLGNRFEVWTVYIEDKTDMQKFADTAHLILGPNHPIMRARHVCAMYHLYPTGFEENCIPNRETGEDGGAALVDQKSLFRMIQAVERCGIPTRFPHPSGFYELLTSKRWTYMMSLTPHLRVPPTICMPRMLTEHGCATAAKKGLAALTSVKAQQAKLRNEGAVDRVTKGVAKLGFSWEALDVKFWEGEKGLEDALRQLSQTIEISGETTGQPHDVEGLIVQEYCEHDLELRLYVVAGKVEATIYTKFCRIKDNLEFGDFKESFDQKDAATQWLEGDLTALQEGERQCHAVTQEWLVWVRAQISELPPAIRFDYFIGRGPQPGQVSIWTLEICELGFSMLGETHLPAKVFRAMLSNCLEEELSGPEHAAAVSSKGEGEEESIVQEERGAGGPSSRLGGPVEDVSASLEGEDAEVVPPPTLYISIPAHMFEDQVACSGMYQIMPRREANGFPIWKHVSEKRWLFFGNDDYWYIGDEVESQMSFNCNQGYVRHEGEGMTMPTALISPWERGPEWIEEPEIVISLEEKAPTPSGGKAKKGKGKAKKSK